MLPAAELARPGVIANVQEGAVKQGGQGKEAWLHNCQVWRHCTDSPRGLSARAERSKRRAQSCKRLMTVQPAWCEWCREELAPRAPEWLQSPVAQREWPPCQGGLGQTMQKAGGRSISSLRSEEREPVLNKVPMWASGWLQSAVAQRQLPPC